MTLPLQSGSVRLMLIRDVDSGAIVDAEVFFTADEADRARAGLVIGLDGEFRDYRPERPRPWECPLCHSLFERPGFEHEPCRTDLEPARLCADLAQLRAQLAKALVSIRILDRLRPTCVLCHDATADRQTTRGPACSDCVGDPPDDGPDPDRPETWAFPEPDAPEPGDGSFPEGDPRDTDYIGGYRPGLEDS
jgi:hypothetical protein